MTNYPIHSNQDPRSLSSSADNLPTTFTTYQDQSTDVLIHWLDITQRSYDNPLVIAVGEEVTARLEDHTQA